MSVDEQIVVDLLMRVFTEISGAIPTMSEEAVRDVQKMCKEFADFLETHLKLD